MMYRCMKSALTFTMCLFVLYAMVACEPPAVQILTDNSSTNDGLNEPLLDIDCSTIGYLKSLYGGSATPIKSDISIEGVVTVNDVFGEFYHSIVVEGEDDAIVVCCDVEGLGLLFPVGSTVKILCGGLWLGASGDIIQLGLKPEGESNVGGLSRADIDLHIKKSGEQSICPTIVTIGQLSRVNISRYVMVENVEFVTPEDGNYKFCERDPISRQPLETTHLLRDRYGREVEVVVGSSVSYADDRLPSGYITITAILESFDGKYRLRIANCGYM